jgi:hypothetical protein
LHVRLWPSSLASGTHSNKLSTTFTPFSYFFRVIHENKLNGCNLSLKYLSYVFVTVQFLIAPPPGNVGWWRRAEHSTCDRMSLIGYQCQNAVLCSSTVSSSDFNPRWFHWKIFLKFNFEFFSESKYLQFNLRIIVTFFGLVSSLLIERQVSRTPEWWRWIRSIRKLRVTCLLVTRLGID